MVTTKCYYVCYSELSHLSNLLSKCVELSAKTAIGQAIVLLLEIARDTDENVWEILNMYNN